MKKIILTLIILTLSAAGYSQKVIADETLYYHTVNKFIITTCNETIYSKIKKQFAKKIKEETVFTKKINGEVIKAYRIDFKEEDISEIVKAVDKY